MSGPQQKLLQMNQQMGRFGQNPAPNSNQGASNEAKSSTPGNSGGSPGQYFSTNFYNTLTPKSSIDSIDSFQSIGGGSTSTSIAIGSSPWSSASFGNFNIPPSIQSSSVIGRHGVQYNNGPVDYQQDAFNFNRPDLSFVTDLDVTNDYMPSSSTNANNNHRLSGDLTSIHHQQQPPHLQNQMFKPSNSKSRMNSGGSGSHTHSSSGNSQLHVDPAIENEFRNMAKLLEEKESIVADLKLQLEALVTAVTVAGGANDKGVREVVSAMKMDVTEIAHRVIIRLKMLKDENEAMGVSAVEV